MSKILKKYLFIFTIFTTVVLFSCLTYELWYTNKFLAKVRQQYLPGLQVSSAILHFNHQISNAVTMSVQSPTLTKWHDLYDNNMLLINDAISKLKQVFSQSVHWDLITKKISRDDLNKIESQIFGLIEQKKYSKANELHDKQLPIKKNEFNNDVANLAAEFEQRLKNCILRHERRTKLLSTIYISAAVIWLFLLITLIKLFHSGEKLRIKIEHDLQYSQTRFRDLAFSSADILWEINAEGEYTYLSGKVEEILGYKNYNMIGKKIFDFCSPAHGQDENFSEFREYLISHIPIIDLKNNKLTLNGETVYFISSAVPIMENNIFRGYRGVDKDITQQVRDQQDKKTMQDQVYQSSKLASIGVLASGVAHELNNPLTGIIGFAQTIATAPDNRDKIRDRALKIVKAADRMKTIIDHLRQFSRESSPRDWRPIDLNDPIRHALVLLNSQLKFREITFNLNLDKNISRIWGDSNRLESIFQNFISNSRDSFEDVKDNREFVVTISTKDTPSGVEVRYSDNAAGMSEKTIDHLFDPFFTTKDVGKGTGLGMSVSHGIIKEHNAKISVSSVEGVGTEFVILFPFDRRKRNREDGEQESSHSDKKQIETIQTGAEETIPGKSLSKNNTILVIDDEEFICELLQDFLEDLFHVEVSSDALTAMEMIKNNDYDLIMTDLKMPKASGMDIIMAVKDKKRSTPVILMSGHAREEVEIKNAIQLGATEILTKPFEGMKQVIDLVSKYIKKND